MPLLLTSLLLLLVTSVGICTVLIRKIKKLEYEVKELRDEAEERAKTSHHRS